MDVRLPRKEWSSLWPAEFAERFEVLGTLGSSRICRSFLVRQRDLDAPSVGEWYFGHRDAVAPAAEAAGGVDPLRVDPARHRLTVPFWAGTCEDGSWLGVRAWLEEPLVLPGRSVTPDELARWLAQAALALGYVHAQGRLHGYVRPDCLFLDEKHNLLLVLGPSLGLYQPAPAQAEVEPMWNSPERLQGRILGPTSDLYALGLCFYRLATGRPPFTADGPELVRQQISQSVRSPLLYNAKLGLPLARILDRLLHKEPAERFQGANELIETINRFMGSAFPTEKLESVRPSLRPARWIEPVSASSALVDLLEATRRGLTGLAVVEGEAGVGKGELLSRLRARHPEVNWIRGRARPRGEPLEALVSLLASLPRAPRLPASGPAGGASSEAPHRAAPSRRLELFRWALELLGPNLPLVLQIDAAELLDLPSLDLLCHLLTRLEAGGFLVLLSQNKRSGPAPVHRYVSRLSAVPVTWISVPRHGLEQSAELVRSMLGQSLPELEDRLYALARGNAKCSELILHLFLSLGSLRARQGRWSFEPDLVPAASFDEAIREALRRGSEEERLCLHALEVLDRPASPQELTLLLAWDRPAEALFTRLESARLLESRDGFLWIPNEELVRQLREALLPEERQRLHRRAYEILLPRSASSEELAYHALRCGAQAAAARHLIEAAASRAELYDVARAVELYESALQYLGPQDSELRLQAWGRLGFLTLLQGNSEVAERYTTLAIDLALRPETRLGLLDQLARIHIRSGAYDRALEALDQALDLASDRLADRIRMLAEKGWLCMRMGQAERAETLLHEALTLASDSGLPDLADLRHAYLGRLAWSRGQMQDALGHFIAAVDAAERGGQLEEVIIQHLNLATLHSNLGHGSIVVDLCETVLRLTEQTGELYEEARALNLLGIHYSEQGLPARAIACYQKALEDAERLPNAILIATVCINLGGLYKDLGDLEEGISALRRAKEVLGPCQNLGMLAEAQSAMAEIEMALGDVRACESSVRAALEMRRRGGHVRGQAMDLYWLGRALQEQGQLDEARRLYQEALALNEGKPGSSFEPHALLGVALAEVLLEANRPGEARRVLADAEPGLDAHRLSWPSFVRWMVRCRLDSGPEARVAADRALAVAEHLKNPELIALAQAAAGRCELDAGNRRGAFRQFRLAAEGILRLAERIRDPALRQRYLAARRRAQILESAQRLEAESAHWM
jgi:tetratricopeptide (TPR) repeat protein